MPGILDDYITVAQRIERFYERFPEGSLQARIIELTEDRVVMEASAYRSAEDQRPGIGYSSMPIPARNQMLRDSEIETCETSAWGRAIAALGFEVKKGVASRNEIDAKAGEPNIRDEVTTDGGLIGTVEKGTAVTSDFELRQTTEGWFLGFRLKGGGRKAGWLVEVHGDMAQALKLLEGSVVGSRVQAWGHTVKRDLKNGGSYQALYLERLVHPDFILPAGPDGTDHADAAPLAASEAKANATPTDAAGRTSEEAPQTPASSPTDTSEGAGGPPETAEAGPLPVVQAGVVAASMSEAAPFSRCGNKGSLDTVCTLEKGHSGRHRELAVDGRVLASW